MRRKDIIRGIKERSKLARRIETKIHRINALSITDKEKKGLIDYELKELK